MKGKPYTPHQIALLIHLHDKRHSWSHILDRFNATYDQDRSLEAIRSAFYYHTKERHSQSDAMTTLKQPEQEDQESPSQHNPTRTTSQNTSIAAHPQPPTLSHVTSQRYLTGQINGRDYVMLDLLDGEMGMHYCDGYGCQLISCPVRAAIMLNPQSWSNWAPGS